MASSCERELRDAVANYCRKELPQGRVVHELKVLGGINRVDIAIILKNRIITFELKSEKDILDKAAAQIKSFEQVSHQTYLVAHKKHFKDNTRNDGSVWRGLKEDIDGRHRIWEYPCPECAPRWDNFAWQFQDIRHDHQPHSRLLLDLLWRAELLEESRRHGVPLPKRPNMHCIIEAMLWHMNGRDICYAVCRQLRKRPFAEADAPILEGAAA